MLFAVIGNIDGNDRALNAALDAIEEEGIHTILHTGNAAAGAPGGNEVLALLERSGVICVQGNTDRLTVRYSRKQDTLDRKMDGDLLHAVRHAHESLTSQNLETLRDWRKSRTITLEGIAVYVCHGAPGSPREILAPDTPLMKMQRLREIARADIIVCGGAERPFSRLVDGALFVAPGPIEDGSGSVARYTLVNTEERPWVAVEQSIAL